MGGHPPTSVGTACRPAMDTTTNLITFVIIVLGIVIVVIIMTTSLDSIATVLLVVDILVEFDKYSNKSK